MNMTIYRRCINAANEYDELVSIGGGEPTLHPKFLEMLCYAIGECDSDIPPWFSTNGTNEEITLMAIKLNLAGAIGLRISLDQFHDETLVSDHVMKAIESQSKRKLDISRDRRTVMAVGRAKTMYLGNMHVLEDCVCDDLFIDPKGNVYFCGCKSEVIGTYKDLPVIIKWKQDRENDTYDCWKSITQEQKKELQEISNGTK